MPNDRTTTFVMSILDTIIDEALNVISDDNIEDGYDEVQNTDDFPNNNHSYPSKDEVEKVAKRYTELTELIFIRWK